jgi:putative transcriptional regulator
MGRIIVNLDVELAKRKMSLSELAEKVGLTLANLSILKTGKAKAVRFTTLETVCRVLDCQPGDNLEYRDEECDSQFSFSVIFMTSSTENLPEKTMRVTSSSSSSTCMRTMDCCLFCVK